MDLRYLRFSHPTSPYYDDVANGCPDLPQVSGPLPSGWSRVLDSEWCHVQPPALDLPDQGWKIHVSAVHDNSERILEAVWDYCIEHDLLFKFIRSLDILDRRNSKYGDRSASGKFVTVYPRDEAQVARTLAELHETIGGEAGPYILSDLRHSNGPLYVRYGGFRPILAPDSDGRPVHCIKDPEGRLIPDRRTPVFRTPPWVVLPDCLKPDLEARLQGTLAGFPFRPTRALHFSNGGGVYEAVQADTGERVLMKEARPLAGLDESGRDAVLRLERERWALEELQGSGVAPATHTFRRGHEHFFLIREFVAGESFASCVERLNPLLGGPEALDEERYVGWAEDVLARVADAVQTMHRHGVVFGDVHPNNILVRDDGHVTFIDFEASSAVDDDAPQRIGAPGFRAPLSYRGPAVDLFGLACVRLSAYLPLTAVLHWGGEKLPQLFDSIDSAFRVPPRFRETVLDEMGLPAESAAGEAPSMPRPDLLRDALVHHIRAAATPEREDRLFPGDITQFTVPGGGLNAATGAAGVLHALHGIGATVEDVHVAWLIERTRATPTLRPGLWDGLAGIAWVLDTLGRHDEADATLERCLDHPLDDVPPSLFEGTAGIGLALLHFARTRQDQGFLRRATLLAAGANKRFRGSATGGLLHGPAGSALLNLRLAETTGDDSFRDAAIEAMRHDLLSLGWTGDGSSAGAWSSPTLVGGAGSLVVLNELLPLPDERLARAHETLKERLLVRFHHAGGLAAGRAGAMMALALVRPTTPWAQAALERHATDLSLHAVAHHGGVGMLGEMNLRMSTDLATGSAGVLTALACVHPSSTTSIPFLGA